MRGRMWCAAALAAALMLSSGCCHWCRRPCSPRSVSVITPPPSLPGGCPPCPPSGGPLPPRAQPAPPPPVLPETPAPSASPFTPSPPGPGANLRGQGEDFVWRPSVPEAPERESAKLMPPESPRPAAPAPEPPAAAVPPAQSEPPPAVLPPSPPRPRESAEPPIAAAPRPKPAEVPTTPPMTVPSPPRPGVKEEISPPPTLPVDIPQFAVVKKDVASGLKPYPDGLKWLAANGYRAVLHLVAPGEEDSGDRKLAEKNGLKYLTLTVSAETLSPEVVQQFNALVADPGNLPLFVYDKEGMIAGGLWYLHFRSVDGASDEDARAKAGRLGIKPDLNGEHRTMWLAVQKVWAAIKPKE